MATSIPKASRPRAALAPKRSLVLAGGGMRVAYQAGVIRALHEAELHFDHIDGTSGGVFNLAMLLSGQTPSEMCDRWRALDVHDFASAMPITEYLRPFSTRGLSSADGLQTKVFPQLGIDFTKIRKAQSCEGSFNVCNFAHKQNEVIDHTRIDASLLTACVSLPMLMPSVEHNGVPYVDSVWIQDANCMEAVRRGAEEIWVVWCIGNARKYRRGLFEQYVQMIELSANSALFDEFRQIRELNARIAEGETPMGRTTPIRVHLIKPEYPLPLDPELYFGKITTASLIDQGYADAWGYLRALPPAGIELGPEATRMREPRLGLAFREVMRGPFSLHELDPAAGARRGRDLGHELVLNASIDVRDIERFVRDPQHTGQLTGHIDFAPLGHNLSSKVGVFNLLSPGPEHALKYMVYELGFEAAGQDYYLAGRKRVRDHAGFDLWSDTTTLFSRLHFGKNADGPVVGAGVLRLSPVALLRMLGTVSARNPGSLIERAQALGAFGSFFAGSLVESYLQEAPS